MVDDIIMGPIKEVLWIVILIIVLSILAFALPFIFRKLFSKKNICTCGQKLTPRDEYCPRCGKKVEK